MVNIGLKIKGLMRQNKIDAPELAKKLGKTKQAVYVMLEKEDVSTSVLKNLADIFNVPITFFFTDENEKSVQCQEDVEALKREIVSLKREIDRLRELKLPTKEAKALDVSMKFFEAAKEMFTYYKQINI